MKTYTIKAFVDARPVLLKTDRVQASSWAAAFGKAARSVKESDAIRRSTSEVSIKLTRIQGIPATMRDIFDK